jgi:uncharacterized protein YecT (DUF1311 family)
MIDFALAAMLAAQPADCADAANQMEMNMCAAREFETADAQLNALWARVVAEQRGETIPTGDRRPSALVVLRNAQRAWISFRDNHCTWEGYEARGGTMEPMLYGLCRARLTRERIEQLQPEPLGQ